MILKNLLSIFFIIEKIEKNNLRILNNIIHKMAVVANNIDLYKSELEKDIDILKKKVAELENIIKNDGLKKKRGPKTKSDSDENILNDICHELSEVLFFDYDSENNDSVTSIIVEKGYKGNNAPIITFNKNQFIELYNLLKSAEIGDQVDIVNYDVSEHLAVKDNDGDWAVNYE